MSLANQTFILTIENKGISQLAKQLKQEKANCHMVPLRVFSPPLSWEVFDQQAKQAASFSYLVFTSPRAVQATLRRYIALSLPLHQLPPIAAVGEKTAACLLAYNLKASLIGSPASAQGLLQQFPLVFHKKEKIWFPCGNLVSPLLSSVLEERKAVVSSCIVYCNKANLDNKDRFVALCKTANWIVVTAPSVVETCFSFFAGNFDLYNHISFAAIGKTTAKALEQKGIRAKVIATPQTYEGLYLTLKAYSHGAA